LENVRSLVRAKREMGSARPFLSLGFVAMKRNADELPSVIGLAAELGAAEVRVHGLEPYSEEMANEITYGHGSDTYRHHFEKAVDEAGRLGVGLALPRLEIGPQRRCHPPAHVAWDGTVVPCGETVYARPFYFLKAKREHREVSFGNVREKDFRTIWDSHQYKHFRRSLRRRNFPAACDDCLMSYGVIC
jgi:radical SAM protein with 4Fe4S-binding SPASM domain